MILDSNIVFSVEVSLTSQSTIWLYESCDFEFEAPLYVGMVYYENNSEILKMHSHLWPPPPRLIGLRIERKVPVLSCLPPEPPKWDCTDLSDVAPVLFSFLVITVRCLADRIPGYLIRWLGC